MMEAYGSDVESEASGFSNGDSADLPFEDGPGPSQNGETIVVSDAESDYSGVTNEDDEDMEDDDDDDGGTDWPKEEELLVPKEEEISADEEMYIAEEVQAEELLSVKEEIFSDTSDVDFAGFYEPVASSGPANRNRRGLSADPNFTVREEDEDDDGEYDDEEPAVKSEPLEWESGGASLPLSSSNDVSQLRCVPIKRLVKKPERKSRTTKLFHCYYCPASFKMKAYLPRHVLRHLKDGSPKYEVTDSNGNKVHPAYVEGTVWPRRQSEQNQQYRFKTWRGRKFKVLHCYYCPAPFRLKAYLPSHVLEHLAKGDPKFEVVDPTTGKKVHPAYLEGQRERSSPSRRNKNQQEKPSDDSDDKTYKCHLCHFKSKHLNVLRAHLKLKPKQALMPKSFSCFHCGWTTERKVDLWKHIRGHIPGLYKCELCAHRAHTPSQLESHMRLHTGEKPYSCNLCGERFAQKFAQKRHMLSHKSRSRKCPHCAFSAATGSILSEHIKDVHLGSKNYRCPKCHFETGDTTELRSHVRSIHRMKLEKLKCRWCDFETGWSSSLNIHERTHYEPEGYTCEHCAFTHKCKNRFKMHMWTHTGEKPFACNLCDYRSTARKSVVRHMVTHNADCRPFKCPHCGKTFKTKQSEMYHERYVHKQVEKKFRCRYCDYKAYHKATVADHETTHTGEKSFPCSECGYVGRLKFNLLSHMRTHARGGDHKCDFCDFRSTSSGGISTHMLFVHPEAKPFICMYCSASFRLKPELVDHERIHTGEKKRVRRKGLLYKRFKCRFCDFETVPIKRLRSHYEQVHPDEMKEQIIPELVKPETQNAGGRKKKPKTKRKCRFCNFESTVRRTVRIHEQIHIYEMTGKFGDKVIKM